jgi:acetolactate synthase-1/2/3 large subunit
MRNRTGWDVVVEALLAEGVEYVFGLPGHPADLYDALYDEPRIRPVLVRHEAAGGFMAMAYSLVSGRPAVCFAPPGPGIAHLVAPMLEALATCAPVIAPCPGIETKLEGRGAFQETEHLAIMRPVTKWAHRVASPETVGWAMHRAFSLATNGQPGPVFLEIPPTAGRASASGMPPYVPSIQRVRCAADPARVDEAVRALCAARAPIIVAGGGVRHSRAHKALILLARALAAPILTTPSGRGSLVEDDPLSVGQVGLYRTDLGRRLLDEADVLLAAGTRLEQTQTGAWAWLPPNAKLIRIDICAEELSRNLVPEIPLFGDARLVLHQLVDGVEWHGAPADCEARFERIARQKREYEVEVEAECRADDSLFSKRVVHEVNRVFGRNTLLVHENGSQDLWSYYSPYYRVLDLDGTVCPGEQTCMGAGVMGAIGAKLARPDRQVVCVTGDGAFQMYNQDIPTAVQMKTPVTWVVLNNNALGWIKYRQQLLGKRYIAVDFEAQPDFVGLAHAYGCTGERVAEAGSIAAALQRAKHANVAGRPAVVIFDVDSSDLPAAFRQYVQ